MEEMAVSIQQVSENAVLSATWQTRPRHAKKAWKRQNKHSHVSHSGQVQETSKRIKRLGERCRRSARSSAN